MRKRFMLLAIALSVCTTHPAAAEGSKDGGVAAIGDVIVTGTRTERKPVEVPAAVDVVGREEIEESRGFSLGEVLDELAGVQAQSKNGAYDSHIIIRGAGAQADYGVRQIMIMVDGIPITDPDSFTRLDPVDMAFIERVEVVKGPNSTLYGANAAGGVINIITKNAYKDAGLGLKASYGSYDAQSYNLTYGGGTDKFGYLLSASRRDARGWRQHNKFDSTQVNGKFDYALDPSSDVQMHLSYTESNLELPGSLTKEQFESDPSQVSSSWPNSGRYSDSGRAALSYNKVFGAGHNFKAQAYYQDWYHYHPVYASINDGGAYTYGLDLQQDLNHSILGGKGVFTVGATGMWDYYDSDKFKYKDIITGRTGPFTRTDASGDLLGHTDAEVSNYGVYAQEEWRPFNKLIITGGARYDEVDYYVQERTLFSWSFSGASGWRYVSDPGTTTTEKKFSHISPRIGATYLLTDNASVYGSVSTGFQTPTRGEIVTNLNLKPAETVNYETGIKARVGAHRVDLTLFYADLKDEIVKIPNPDGSTDTFYDNAGKSTHKGVELGASIRLIEGLSLGLNYAYSDFVLKEFVSSSGQNLDGNRLPLVPMHKYSASLNYAHPSGLSAKVGTDTWGRYWVDEANTETYDGFTTVSARIGYDKKDYGLFVSADNILDEEYAAEVTKSRGTTSYSPGAPLTFMAGIRYNFD